MDAETARRLVELEQRLARLESIDVPGAVVAWTPRYSATVGPGGYTYVTQAGGYCRIGPFISFYGQAWISAITTPPSGNMVVDGLPAAAVAIGGCFFADIWNFNNAASAVQLVGQILPGESFIRLVESFDNANSVAAPAANFTNVNCSLVLVGMYRYL
jgi:hypothetical protein